VYVPAPVLPNAQLASRRETVSSVGVIWDKTLPFTTANTTVKTFRQALALDEVRANYHMTRIESDIRIYCPAPSQIPSFALPATISQPRPRSTSSLLFPRRRTQTERQSVRTSTQTEEGARPRRRVAISWHSRTKALSEQQTAAMMARTRGPGPAGEASGNARPLPPMRSADSSRPCARRTRL
jgi:uncharacterized protein (DUF2235 family)